MADTGDSNDTTETGTADVPSSQAKQGRPKLIPNSNHDNVKQERGASNATSKRIHHCPDHDCYAPIGPRCYKLGHVVDCPKHQKPHRPQDPCLQCVEEADAIARLERKKEEEAAKAAAEEAEKTVGGFLENLKRHKEKKEKKGKQPKDSDKKESWSSLGILEGSGEGYVVEMVVTRIGDDA